MTVDSSSSESDSEESESKSESDSSDSSDSDVLESWMILGRGKQDGDHSISLNLEQGSDSNAGVSLLTCGLVYVYVLFLHWVCCALFKALCYVFVHLNVCVTRRIEAVSNFVWSSSFRTLSLPAAN